MKITAVNLGNKLNDAIDLIHEAFYKINIIDKENAQMSAKIFAYEAILQNSNFKMAVVRKKKNEREEHEKDTEESI